MKVIMEDTIIHHDLDTHFNDLKVIINDTLAEDKIEDELFISMQYEDKINILTAIIAPALKNSAS